MKLERYEVLDPVDDLTSNPGAVEVRLRLESGQERWCFFMTPDRLQTVGDILPGTDTRIHHGAEHMIVLTSLTSDSIDLAIRYLCESDQIMESSRPLGAMEGG